MGVILCDSPTGPFSVTVIPKCGSTTVRYMLADVAKPGQYLIMPRVKVKVQKQDWQLSERFTGEHIDRSWGVLRNPWRRLISRWREKGLEKTGTTWPDYVRSIGEAQSDSIASRIKSTVSLPQSYFLGEPRPRRLVAIENAEAWKAELEQAEGVHLRDVVRARSHGGYDWRQLYRDHLETTYLVRDIFLADWKMGIEWENPLDGTPLAERRRAEIGRYERPRYNRVIRPWRVRLVTEWLKEHADRGDSCLDVGSGKAETRAIAHALGLSWRGCDVVQSVCKRGDVDLIPGAHKLPYLIDQFDYTVCNDVMEHILEEDVPAALQEMSRVTRKGILLGISRKPDKHGYHVTIKSERWWMDQVANNMPGSWRVLYADRIKPRKKPYLFVEVR